MRLQNTSDRSFWGRKLDEIVGMQYLKIDWFRIFQIWEEKSPESSNQKYLGKENKDTETQTHVMKLQNIQEGEEMKRVTQVKNRGTMRLTNDL